MKKNILFVIDEKKMGGVSILLEDIINNIDSNKYNIDIMVLHNNGEMLNNLPKNVEIFYADGIYKAVDLNLKQAIDTKNLAIIFYKFLLVIAMKCNFISTIIKKTRNRILKDKIYDTEIAFKDGFTALFTIYGNSKKKVHWLHYEYNKINPNGNYDKLFKRILAKFNIIIAVSNGVMNDFNKIYHLDNKTIVIKNIVDSDKILTKSTMFNDSKATEQFNVISVGRLHYMKGYDRLLNVVSKLQDDKLLNKVNFKIYGDGPEKEALLKQTADLKLTEKVEFLGQVMNPFPYILNSDLFILPSRYEPFGLVMVESMILGTPVFALDNAATDEVIESGFNGFITENSDDKLYEGLKYLLEHIDEISKYKHNLIKYHYPIEKILLQIERVLD